MSAAGLLVVMLSCPLPRPAPLAGGVSLDRPGEIEAAFPEAWRYELFTGHLSEGNLRLYRRLGYAELREEEVSPRLRLAYLEKPGRRS